MGIRKNRLAEAVLTGTRNVCFEQKFEKKKKKKNQFLSEKFQFLEVKFSIYLNRRVFVMVGFSAAVAKTYTFIIRVLM